MSNSDALGAAIIGIVTLLIVGIALGLGAYLLFGKIASIKFKVILVALYVILLASNEYEGRLFDQADRGLPVNDITRLGFFLPVVILFIIGLIEAGAFFRYRRRKRNSIGKSSVPSKNAPKGV